MNRALWERMHEVVLGDLANLVMPNTIYSMRGQGFMVYSEKSFDANCYNKIFSEEYPDVKFLSVGSKESLACEADDAICLTTALPELY